MVALEAGTYRAATAGGLLAATAALGLGIERLAHGSWTLGGALLAVGAGIAAAVLVLDLEGAREERTVLLLTREACPHCDEARAILDHLRDEIAFALWEVDVTEDEDLAGRFGDEVPVVFLGGRKVASMEVREAEIREALSHGVTG